jgi:hypothetical protein
VAFRAPCLLMECTKLACPLFGRWGISGHRVSPRIVAGFHRSRVERSKRCLLGNESGSDTWLVILWASLLRPLISGGGPERCLLAHQTENAPHCQRLTGIGNYVLPITARLKSFCEPSDMVLTGLTEGPMRHTTLTLAHRWFVHRVRSRWLRFTHERHSEVFQRTGFLGAV